MPVVPIRGIGKPFRAIAMIYSLRKSVGAGSAWSQTIGLLLALCCTGCVATGPIGSSTQPNVIVMRGPGGYFPHLAEFEDRLIEEGACPTVAFPEAQGTIAERIIGGRNRGRLTGPIIIVGYSSGANAAVSLSERLGERGIEVDKLVLVEASDSKRVPDNVRACFNIYKSQPWTEYVPVLAGRPIQAASPATELVNYDVREYNDGRFDWDNHLTLAANPHVQDLMIDEVRAAIEPDEPVLPNTDIPIEGDSDDGDAGRASVMKDVPTVD